MKLQGKKQNVPQLVGHIDGFRKKLVLSKVSLQRNNDTHFTRAVNCLVKGKAFIFLRSLKKLMNLLMSLTIDSVTLIG